MSNVAIFDPSATPQRVLEYLLSVNTPDYVSRPDVVINPDVSSLLNVPIKYWKHVTGNIVEMTPAEKLALDSEEMTSFTWSIREGGKTLLDSKIGEAILLRALADIIKDELNLVREWFESFKAQVALASSLADLKTRVAGLPAMPDRTLAQLRTAIKTRIDTGSVDS